MIKTDFLLRIVDKAIVDDVFNNGRKFFEVIPPPGERYSGYSYMRVQPGDMPTMPIDFSVAAYRLGHSMIRGAYQWNRVFRDSRIATLLLLFTFSGTSGILSPMATSTTRNRAALSACRPTGSPISAGSLISVKLDATT
jgi:hypothetical protein